MKDIRFFIPATNREYYEATAKVKEWQDLSEYERKDIAEILAKLVIADYLHPHHPADSVSGTIVLH